MLLAERIIPTELMDDEGPPQGVTFQTNRERLPKLVSDCPMPVSQISKQNSCALHLVADCFVNLHVLSAH